MTGATGYVGGRLVPRLLEAGFRVRVMVRHLERIRDLPWADQVQVAVGDAGDPAAISAARGTSIIVHTRILNESAASAELGNKMLLNPLVYVFFTLANVSLMSFAWFLNSFTLPTRGIIISGIGLRFLSNLLIIAASAVEVNISYIHTQQLAPISLYVCIFFIYTYLVRGLASPLAQE